MASIKQRMTKVGDSGYYTDVEDAANRANAVEDRPYSEFADTKPKRGADYVGMNNKANAQAAADRDIKESLPGGTDRLVAGVKDRMRRLRQGGQ